MAGDTGRDAVVPASCASCGFPLAADAAFCGACGRAVHSIARVSAPISAQQAPVVPPKASVVSPHSPTVSWPSVATTGPAPSAERSTVQTTRGMAALAATPIATPITRAPRHRFIATIAALCVVALVAAGIYWTYAAFIGSSGQTASARYLPDTTVFYASIDLPAATSSSHRAGAFVAQDVTAAIRNALGLDWRSDVAPWIGQLATVGVFPGQLSAGGTPANLASLFNTAVILQSRDDTAARHAIDKALASRTQNGVTFDRSTYNGFTVFTSSADSPQQSVIALGNGLVILTSSVSAAHLIIDRASGQGNTLAGTSDFARETRDLPSDRFGTLYVNLHAITDPLGAGISPITIPFFSDFPTGAGALIWTSTGLRWQMTFPSNRSSSPHPDLGGNTTDLAALVPDNAATYIGMANAGLLAHEIASLLPANAQSGPQSDPLQTLIGLSSTDPTLTQPAAIFVMPLDITGATQQPGSAMLVREPTATAATTLVTRIATQNHWTSQPTTVSGVPAVRYFSTDVITPLTPPSLYPDGTTPTASRQLSPSTPVAVEAYVSGTMVLASNSSALASVIATSKGQHASLSASSRFQQLISAAPRDAAATEFASSPGDRPAFPFSLPNLSSPLPQAQANLITVVWSATQLSATYDLALAQ